MPNSGKALGKIFKGQAYGQFHGVPYKTYCVYCTFTLVRYLHQFYLTKDSRVQTKNCANPAGLK